MALSFPDQLVVNELEKLVGEWGLPKVLDMMAVVGERIHDERRQSADLSDRSATFLLRMQADLRRLKDAAYDTAEL